MTMFEQLLFTILSVVLFGIIFFKIIKKNDTSYVAIIVIEALGLTINFIALSSGKSLNIITKIITYCMSLFLPLGVIILEKKNIDIMKKVKMAIVSFYFIIGNKKMAKEWLVKMSEKDFKDYDLHKKLGKIYEKEGGMRKAIDEYVQCIELNKQDYDSYYKVATLLTDLDRKSEAIEMLNKLLNKKPEYMEASKDLGDLLIQNGSYKEAAMVYLDALKYNPMNYELNYNLGIVYTMLNDFNNAKQCYEKAATINSLSYNAKYNLAEIALLYKELDKAESIFQQVLQDDEFSGDCYFELAKINLIKGNKDIAIKYANIAIDIDSKKTVEKIEREPLFMTIRNKISIPFNLEEKEFESKLTPNEKLAKEHLENTAELTKFMGYGENEEKEKQEFENEFDLKVI